MPILFSRNHLNSEHLCRENLDSLKKYIESDCEYEIHITLDTQSPKSVTYDSISIETCYLTKNKSITISLENREKGVGDRRGLGTFVFLAPHKNRYTFSGSGSFPRQWYKARI